MDKLDFLNWMFDFYKTSEYIVTNEIMKYNNGLLNNIDFEKLQNYVKNYVPTRPNVIELNKYATMYKFFLNTCKNKCPALLHYQYIKETSGEGNMNDLPVETKQKIINFLKICGKEPKFKY